MKPVAAVVLEGTVVDQIDADLMMLGDVLPGAREKLAELNKTHDILIVTALAKTDRGVALVRALLYDQSIPHDEIWMGWGAPVSAVRYDNAAKTL